MPSTPTVVHVGCLQSILLPGSRSLCWQPFRCIFASVPSVCMDPACFSFDVGAPLQVAISRLLLCFLIPFLAASLTLYDILTHLVHSLNGWSYSAGTRPGAGAGTGAWEANCRATGACCQNMARGMLRSVARCGDFCWGCRKAAEGCDLQVKAVSVQMLHFSAGAFLGGCRGVTAGSHSSWTPRCRPAASGQWGPLRVGGVSSCHKVTFYLAYSEHTHSHTPYTVLQ